MYTYLCLHVPKNTLAIWLGRQHSINGKYGDLDVFTYTHCLKTILN